MKQKFSLLVIVIVSVFFWSCDGAQKEKTKDVAKDKKEQVKKEVVKKDCKNVYWTHSKGDLGPDNWKNLCDGFAACGGKSQSPIDINTKSAMVDKKLLAPKFSYGKSKVNVVNNSHTVQFNVDGDNKVNLNGKDYKLLQFHYHALSEHTVDGKHFPLVVHFVHKHSDTDFAALGVLFKEGKSNKLFEKYLDKLPKSKGEYKSENLMDLLSLFPRNKSYYNYDGSLTTPPCGEVVNWYVFKNPVEASKEQIAKFSKILNNNYRPVMPLNGRKVRLFSE